MLHRIESALGRWGRFVALHPVRVIAVVLLFVGALATQLPHFRLETESEGYFHKEDPVRVDYDAFREAFGRDVAVLIAMKPAGGVFQFPFLEMLREIHAEIEEEVPYLVEVTSLVNVRETIGTDDGLEVGDFLEDWPADEAAVRALEARALANPLYRNYVISEDAGITAFVIETEAFAKQEVIDDLEGFGDDGGFDDAADGASLGAAADLTEERKSISSEQDGEITAALRQILARHESPDIEVHLAGSPAFSATLAKQMTGDMALFTGLSVALVALFLAVLFRRVAAVALPLLTVMLSVVSTVAVMAATDTPMMPPTQIIPSFLLAVGIGGAVHLLAIFYQALRRGDEKVEAISYALAHSGLPIIMTSVTTAGGLLSFIPAALRPISHFGYITPIGILLSLLFILTLLPAMMAIFPMRQAEVRDEETASQRALISTGQFATRRAPLVLGLWALMMVICVVGLMRVRLGHNMLEWFPHDDSMYQATRFLNDEFGGASSFEILISTGKGNGLHDPAILRKIDQIATLAVNFEAETVRGAKAVSIIDVVKESHRALNENREAFYAIPDERNLVSQELLLFENAGRDDVEDLVTSDFETARMTVRVPFGEGANYAPYLEALENRIVEILGGDATVVITGTVRMLGSTIQAALQTMVTSYTTALVVITLLMIGLIGSLRMGLVSMIPNLVPVFFALGVMGWLDIPLDMFSLPIGSILIGLAVDDTIHFMHNFRREYEATGDVDAAVTQTLRGTGQALLFTSCVLATGFLVYTQAHMVHLFNFGMVTAASIVVAFLADVTLAPALVKLTAKTPAPANHGNG